MASAFITGIKLLATKERGVEEECAASSFKRVLVTTTLASLLIAGGTVATGGALPSLNPSYTGDYDHSHVAMASGDYGLFSDGDIYSIELGDYALDDLKEGVSLTVYVDEDEQVVGADSVSDPDYLVYLGATIAAVIGVTLLTFVYCMFLLPMLGHDYLKWWMERDGEADVPDIPRGDDTSEGLIIEPVDIVIEPKVAEEPQLASESRFIRDKIGRVNADDLDETRLYPRNNNR